MTVKQSILSELDSKEFARFFVSYDPSSNEIVAKLPWRYDYEKRYDPFDGVDQAVDDLVEYLNSDIC